VTVRRAGALVTTALTALLASSVAHADPTKDQCIDANARAQDLRREGKLGAARAELGVCTARSCPRAVRSDCIKRLDELETAQPTIAFEVKDATGGDVMSVKVTVDGALLAPSLAGTAIPLDPGPHTVTLEANGLAADTRTIVITEGQKGRRERVVLGAPPASVSPPASGPALSGTTNDHRQGWGTQRIAGVVTGGVGVAGLAFGGVLGALTLAAKSKQVSDCESATVCANPGGAQTDHSRGETDGTLATVGFIAAGALVAAGAVLFFTGQSSTDHPAGAGLLVLPTAGPGGGGMLLRAEF